MYACIYIYTERERERERYLFHVRDERDKDNKRVKKIPESACVYTNTFKSKSIQIQKSPIENMSTIHVSQTFQSDPI